MKLFAERLVKHRRIYFAYRHGAAGEDGGARFDGRNDEAGRGRDREITRGIGSLFSPAGFGGLRLRKSYSWKYSRRDLRDGNLLARVCAGYKRNFSFTKK